MNKKIIIIIVIIILIVLMFPKKTDEFRIRVIANSDSSFDQSLKMEVVNILKNEINKLDQSNIVSEIKSNLNLLDNKLSLVLKDTRYTINIENVRFPAKEVDGVIIPGGTYKTLLVVIDEGQGKNWWSLLYPTYHNLSFEDIETKEVEFKFYFFEEIKKSLYKG